MNVLLPYPSLRLSSHVLGTRCLGLQRRHAVYLLKVLAGRSGGHRTWHPLVGLWRGFEPALCYYAQGCFDEMEMRGYGGDAPGPRTTEGAHEWRFPETWALGEVVFPDWLGIERLHASHRAALVMTDPLWYAQFSWLEAPITDFFWPGPLPIAGDRLWSESRGEALVLQKMEGRSRCLLDGEEIEIPDADVRRRKWLRVWR